MDEYILKLRGFDLRLALLIIFVSIIAIMVIFFKNDYNMGFGTGIMIVISTLYFITLVVHSIDRDDIALVVSKVSLGLCAIGFIASLMTYGDMPTFSNIDPFEFLFGKSSIEVWTEGMTIKSAPASVLTGIVEIAAIWYLLRYINKTYRAVWIMLIIILAISTLAAFVLTLGGSDYLVFHKAISVWAIPLSIVQLAMIFKAASNEKKRTSVIKPQETYRPTNTEESTTNPKDNATSDRTKQLFQLKELLDGGILTQEEFNNEKKKILNS